MVNALVASRSSREKPLDSQTGVVKRMEQPYQIVFADIWSDIVGGIIMNVVGGGAVVILICTRRILFHIGRVDRLYNGSKKSQYYFHFLFVHSCLIFFRRRRVVSEPNRYLCSPSITNLVYKIGLNLNTSREFIRDYFSLILLGERGKFPWSRTQVLPWLCSHKSHFSQHGFLTVCENH